MVPIATGAERLAERCRDDNQEEEETEHIAHKNPEVGIMCEVRVQ